MGYYGWDPPEDELTEEDYLAEEAYHEMEERYDALKNNLYLKDSLVEIIDKEYRYVIVCDHISERTINELYDCITYLYGDSTYSPVHLMRYNETEFKLIKSFDCAIKHTEQKIARIKAAYYCAKDVLDRADDNYWPF